jgi:hypothetical protein
MSAMRGLLKNIGMLDSAAYQADIRSDIAAQPVDLLFSEMS